jgi:hypothetical protein
MSDEKKPREYWIHEITTESNGEIPVAFTHFKPKPSIHVIEKSAYDKLTTENAKLRAENYVLRDQGLRTYDGLAQKADAYDELQADNRAHFLKINELQRENDRLVALTHPEYGELVRELTAERGVTQRLDRHIADLERKLEIATKALRFTLGCAENLLRPDKPVHKGLDPTFYQTLTYEGDIELIEQCKAARLALKEIGE